MTANFEDNSAAAFGDESTTKPNLSWTIPRNLLNPFNKTTPNRILPKLENIEKSLNVVSEYIDAQFELSPENE